MTAPNEAPADHPDRLVALTKVHNFRDLGGYRTTSGATTRWKTLYRADGLGNLGAEDLGAIARLGLRTVVDLRTPEELEVRGRYPHEDHPGLGFHNVSIIDRTWDRDDVPADGGEAGFLVWAYRQMLESGGARFGEAINALAAPDALPGVFHCAAGKDRTGLLAMLILGCLEVEHEQIVADYALTNASIVRMRQWIATHHPDRIDELDAVPPAFLAANPEAMRVIVADLVANHGSIAGYVREIGVPDAAIEHLRGTLLES